MGPEKGLKNIKQHGSPRLVSVQGFKVYCALIKPKPLGKYSFPVDQYSTLNIPNSNAKILILNL